MIESRCCNTGKDLSINCDAIESLCPETSKSKSIILNNLPLNSDVKNWKTLKQNTIDKRHFSIMFGYRMTAIINKPIMIIYSSTLLPQTNLKQGL